MTKAKVDEFVEISLHEVHEREARLPVFAQTFFNRFADEIELQEGRNQLGYDERDKQNNQDGPRKEQQEVVIHARHRGQQGEERDGNGQRSREN